ncbi:hypothetical protein M9H77_27754 [Catharanthus roseus]|uniref:Uncharacterized protein n=1 Tax=Catharanthus roseus TaxID=4058 RepID=A0ACC0AE02_CATRO|nr:hypothetical protein M9H77_27754 [Catharanthus roseus]
MGVQLFCNRALVWCLAGIDYEILELGSDDLIKGSELFPWSPTVTLHVLLNLGVEATLMCLDSLRLPIYARNPHLGSSISINSGHLVPRGTQMPNSITVDLVVGLGISHQNSF